MYLFLITYKCLYDDVILQWTQHDPVKISCLLLSQFKIISNIQQNVHGDQTGSSVCHHFHGSVGEVTTETGHHETIFLRVQMESLLSTHGKQTISSVCEHLHGLDPKSQQLKSVTLTTFFFFFFFFTRASRKHAYIILTPLNPTFI